MTELKVVLQTIYEELPQEHINQAPLVVTSSICSNSVYLQVCSLISNKPVLFRTSADDYQ